MSKKYNSFVEYWEAVKNLSQLDRREIFNNLSEDDRNDLRVEYTPYLPYFAWAEQVKSYDDWCEWSADKSREERILLISVMSDEQRRSLIEDRRTRARNTMTTPRFEFRFSNGDIFFSDKQDTELATKAIIIADHQSKTILKDRYGQNGPEAYARIFPPKKHENAMAFKIINTDARLIQNGDALEVWSGDKLLRAFKEDENVHFAVWRLLSVLANVK